MRAKSATMVASVIIYVSLFSLILTNNCFFSEELYQNCLADGTCTAEEDAEDDLINGGVIKEYECVNEDEDCEFWASLEPSECIENPSYMGEFCRKACVMCEEPISVGVPQLVDEEGVRSAEVKEMVSKAVEYMTNVVMVEPKYEKVRYHCKNKEEDCSLWALDGECEESSEFMALNCGPACQSCEMMLYEERCPWDKSDKGVWERGDVNRMFEKILTFPVYKKYQPRALSRPYYSKGDSKASSVDYQIGPWVVILEDFLSPHESDTLIELGHKEGFERSADVGEVYFDGTFDDDVNEGRTSTNAWCEDVCIEDPVAQDVIQRIEDLTGIPKNNSEYLQLLRYEPKQHYVQHHDYIDFEVDRPQGVRLMTLYLYLNDVEGGGGTRFPLLDNLTVQPKRGRALLWPSVLDDDPNSMDWRTEHEALPVTKGLKYGANSWLHQRDFVTPNENGCS